jgi:hypothetical protein
MRDDTEVPSGENQAGVAITPREELPTAGQNVRGEKIRGTLALILLSVTALLTAWCGFEASKWGGEMSIAFSRASAARIEAAKQQGIANNARQQDLTVYGVFLQAEAAGNDQLARYVSNRFSNEFKVAFEAWNTAGRTSGAPFDLPEYVPRGTRDAEAADKRADDMFAQGLQNNQRGDNYTMLTVLAALVLFFTAISERLNRAGLRWTAMVFAALLFAAGVVMTFILPVVI